MSYGGRSITLARVAFVRMTDIETSIGLGKGGRSAESAPSRGDPKMLTVGHIFPKLSQGTKIVSSTVSSMLAKYS